MTDINHIIFRLYLSALGPACDVYDDRPGQPRHMGKVLNKHINYILYLNKSNKPEEVLKKYEEYGIRHLFVEVTGSQPDQWFARAFHESRTFIQMALSRDENILIHCNDGVNVAPAIIIAFLLEQSEPGDDMLGKLRELLERKHPMVNIEESLWQQLVALEQQAKQLN